MGPRDDCARRRAHVVWKLQDAPSGEEESMLALEQAGGSGAAESDGDWF